MKYFRPYFSFTLRHWQLGLEVIVPKLHLGLHSDQLIWEVAFFLGPFSFCLERKLKKLGSDLHHPFITEFYQ